MSDHNETPADVTPRRGLTTDTLDMLDTLARRGGTVTEPGRVHVDVDGMPIAVDPPRATKAAGAGAWITPADLAALGITVDQAGRRWPNVHIADTDLDISPPGA